MPISDYSDAVAEAYARGDVEEAEALIRLAREELAREELAQIRLAREEATRRSSDEVPAEVPSGRSGLGVLAALAALVVLSIAEEVYEHGSAMTRIAIVGVPYSAVLLPLVLMGARRTRQRNYLSAASYRCSSAFLVCIGVSLTVGNYFDDTLHWPQNAPLIIWTSASWALPAMGLYYAAQHYCRCGGLCEPRGRKPVLARVPILGAALGPVCERCSGVIHDDPSALEAGAAGR